MNGQNPACNSINPIPPSLWERSTIDCINCQNPNCSATSIYISPQDLDMRRKAEIFKYKQNSSNETKKQKYALAAKGINIYKKQRWATQSQTYTDPNIEKLPQVGNTLQCLNNNIIKSSPTTNNDVPGPIIQISYDKNIPLTNYITRRIYTFNGTKWPQTSWKPGDNGFPVGKSGRRFLL